MHRDGEVAWRGHTFREFPSRGTIPKQLENGLVDI
jgi:hypothetical protein